MHPPPNHYIMDSLTWSHEHVEAAAQILVNIYYLCELFSALTLISSHLPSIHHQPGQMAHSLPLFHHCRSSDKRPVGQRILSQRPDGRGVSAEEALSDCCHCCCRLPCSAAFWPTEGSGEFPAYQCDTIDWCHIFLSIFQIITNAVLITLVS